MARFDYFVVLADRRTGSNFLEANLNALNGVRCHGEAFNGNFVGSPKRKDLLGVTLAQRDADPDLLLGRIKAQDGLNGFRYFGDHDARIMQELLEDPRCGKIILTRDPIESFVSLEIARATDQWMLKNVARRRVQKITFDASKFQAHLNAVQNTLGDWSRGMKRAGQTAFHVTYEDLGDLDILNGLATYLGIDARLAQIDQTLKKQNPEPMSEKVENFDEMLQALAQSSLPDFSKMSSFEPQSGPSVPTFIAAPRSSLLYLPIPFSVEAAVTAWLAALDDATEAALLTGFSQRSLRDWKRDHVGHRSFTVVRHPVARAHAAFCEKVLVMDAVGFAGVRKTLTQQFNIDLPEQYPDANYTHADHKEAFVAYLKFVKSNLAGQTANGVESHWASQVNVLKGFADVIMPDLVLREDRLEEDLAILAAQIGKETMPQIGETDPHASLLGEIYDADVENTVKDVYQRDYDAFGFGPYT